MRVLLLTLACLFALPAAAQTAKKPKAPAQQANPPSAYLSKENGPPSGEVAADGGKAVILPQPPPPGQRVNVPEGWWQVDSAPSADQRPPGVLVAMTPTPASKQARAEAAKQPARPAAPSGPPPPPEAAPPPPPGYDEVNLAEACRDEREAYAKRLLRMAGIEEVEHPLDLFEGLGLGFDGSSDAALSPYVRLSLFGLPAGGSWEPQVAGVPVVRNLAFDFELQNDAARLAKCVADNRD